MMKGFKGCAFFNPHFLTPKNYFMGKLDSALTIRGTIGNITFSQTKNGYVAKQKTGPRKSSMATGSQYELTRKNWAEFGRAARASGAIRRALSKLTKSTADSGMVNRLTQKMRTVILADTTNPRGQRNVLDGNIELLQPFEFNGKVALTHILTPQFVPTINRLSGELKVFIPSFDPSKEIRAPFGTTHFKITAAGFEVDFEKNISIVQSTSTGYLPWDSQQVQDISLINMLPVASVHPLFIALGIEFFMDANNVMDSVQDKSFNALALVKVLGL
jgi:hypothetical protein